MNETNNSKHDSVQNIHTTQHNLIKPKNVSKQCQSSELNGCGRCNYRLSDIKLISFLDDISIKHIFQELIEQCSLFPSTRILLGKSTITCNGDISIKYKICKNYNNIKHNRTICFRVIDEWLRNNVNKVFEVMNILYLIICAAVLYYDDNQQQACKVLANFESINTFVHRYFKDITT